MERDPITDTHIATVDEFYYLRRHDLLWKWGKREFPASQVDLLMRCAVEVRECLSADLETYRNDTRINRADKILDCSRGIRVMGEVIEATIPYANENIITGFETLLKNTAA